MVNDFAASWHGFDGGDGRNAAGAAMQQGFKAAYLERLPKEVRAEIIIMLAIALNHDAEELDGDELTATDKRLIWWFRSLDEAIKMAVMRALPVVLARWTPLH